jgi:hypothetical protein
LALRETILPRGGSSEIYEHSAERRRGDYIAVEVAGLLSIGDQNRDETVG